MTLKQRKKQKQDTSNKSDVASSPSAPERPESSTSWMKTTFGFELSDFRSFDSFVRLCNSPADPSGLAAFRLAFGCFMVLDCVHERGLSRIVEKWSDEFEACHFPLFEFVKPLPIQWMVFVYLFLGFGAMGIAFGFFYRLSCLVYVILYWYLFFLEKSVWNNHSYLFGLTATLFLFMDANRYWSIDAKRNKDLANAKVPIWQYGILRYQVILVYFVAGLKKLDRDWVHGYSMTNLAGEWVFDPFRPFLTNEQIDLYIVHGGGLIIDLLGGFLLFFDQTRYIGTAMVTSFHVMNSRMFSIGQFPYVMLCTSAIFYQPDWPKKVFSSKWLSKEPEKLSSHVISSSKQISSFYHKFCSVFVVLYAVWQAFMPYSHCLTQGYNSWAGGLYGYSWNMMIHNFQQQHIKIRYVDRATGEEGFLDPTAFVTSDRWAMFPDMMKQHAKCIAKILQEDYDVYDPEIYMDIWLSMNKRFHQRIVDPSVDLVRADWSPFRPASYLLPLLNDLEDWRLKIEALTSDARSRDLKQYFDSVDVTFIADFPGMMLENYIDEDLGRTNITLLAGSAVLHYPDYKKNVTLKINEPIRVKVGMHEVFVESDIPACYMYTYSNTTEVELEKQLIDLEAEIMNKKITADELQKEAEKNATLKKILTMREEKHKKTEESKGKMNKTLWESNVVDLVTGTYHIFSRSFWMSFSAVESMVTGESMVDIVERRLHSDSTQNADIKQ